MRRLRLSFIDNLEDAVTNRDARRIRDLQRQFSREVRERQENFQTTQGRERQDNNRRLTEIRENETNRSQEIMAEQTRQLEALRIHEDKRNAEIDASLQEELQTIRQKSIEAQASEQQSHQERQAELNNALAARLLAVAKELADEDNITKEGAAKILGTLNDTFGQGGDIDNLMRAFAERQSRQIRLALSFGGELRRQFGTSLEESNPVFAGGFAHGGSVIARKPTLALFGENTPEQATFTPLNQMQNGGGQPQKMQIEFSGSAPPGIRGGEIEQIAGIINRAFREAGA